MVKGLDHNLNEDTVKEYFERAGRISDINWVREWRKDGKDSKGKNKGLQVARNVCYVKYEDGRDLWQDAVYQDHGPALGVHGARLGNRIVEVYRSRKPAHSQDWFPSASKTGWSILEDDLGNGGVCRKSVFRSAYRPKGRAPVGPMSAP